MAGHSKWAQIKHKKAHTDAKRGKIFTKLVKEISVAARLGGGDPDGNPRLRTALQKAKEANMPSENIKRAIMKGTGELPGTVYEECVYEGYGPAGVAIYIEVLTDNKNRTVSDLRHILSKNGGNMGEAGCVSWMFQKKGFVIVEKSAIDEDTLMSACLDAGAEDMRVEDDSYEVITSPEMLETVKSAIEKLNIPISAAEISMLPQSYIELTGADATQMLKLIDALEDNDDVQNIYHNAQIKD